MLSLLVGLLCGILSGFGIGGGSLLMLYLTFIAGLSPLEARTLNLLYFLPTALASLLLHAKNRFVSWPVVLPAALSGCLTGGLLAWCSTGTDNRLLRWAFGALLLFAGVTELRAGLQAQPQ